MNALNAAGAKATFFVTGTLYNCIYSQAAVLNATFAAGHQIASHTWDHKGLNTLSASEITTQMTKLETALANIIGVKPTYMRPPNGATGGQTVSVMKSMGYRLVTWDVDSGDNELLNVKRGVKPLSMLKHGVVIGLIVIFHLCGVNS